MAEPARRRPVTHPSARTFCALLAFAVVSALLTAPASADDPPEEVDPPAVPELGAAAAEEVTTIAAVSDFGYASVGMLALRQMVDSWDPDYVITTGDNVQTSAIPGTGVEKYDFAVGRLFCRYMKGSAPGRECPSGGDSRDQNRFFPSTGNHDWTDGGIENYRAYFDLPGPGTTRRTNTGTDLYYDVVMGPVHLFVLDSEPMYHERNLPSAQRTITNAQRSWLQAALSASDAPWQMVTLHDPIHGSSSTYGSAEWLHTWDLRGWGADIVLNGHASVYERVMRDGVPYVTNGLGGGNSSPGATGFVDPPVAGSVVRFNGDFLTGARIEATSTTMRLQAISTNGATRDTYVFPHVTTTSLPAATVGVPYSARLAAAGGRAPHEFRVSSGSLPPGLSLASDGRLSGTPTSAGTRSFTVTVTDADRTISRPVGLEIGVGAAPATSGGAFVGITPNRVLNTRVAGSCVKGPARQATVAPSAGVPANAVAVAMNVTVTDASAPGYLTAYPAGRPRPTASNLNYGPRSTVPNMVTSAVGANGEVSLFASAGCPNVIVDVLGYYTAGATGPGGFVGMTPTRALNTRASSCVGGAPLELELAGKHGVPGDASAVALNVTVTMPRAPGYLTAYPAGVPRPLASNLNYGPGQTIANHVTTKLGSGGRVSLHASAGCPHVVVDVLGYYTRGPAGPGGFVGITPSRVLNTGVDRCVAGVRHLTIAPSDGVPRDAAAVALNVTVTRPTASGFLAVYPNDFGRPNVSNLNYVARQTVPNAVVSKVGRDGSISLYASGGCPDVIVDVVGYHTRT